MDGGQSVSGKSDYSGIVNELRKDVDTGPATTLVDDELNAYGVPNPRLLICGCGGIDLVKEQIRIAHGERLNLRQKKIKSKILSLPCINMNEFGLKYESYFVLFDYYISDTGRRFWSTGEDPLMTVKNLQNSITVQCLFHPTWWKYYLD